MCALCTQQDLREAEQKLERITDWLNDNDHRLYDGGDSLWKILNGEET